MLLVLALLQATISFSERSRLILSVSAVALFVFFIGGRGFIGWDWTNYYPYFENAAGISDFTHHKWVFADPGWNIYTSLVKTITRCVGWQGMAAYNFFILLSAFIDGVLLFLFFHRHVGHKYFVFALAVFMVFYGFTFETDLMRNVKGLLIYLLSVRYIETNQWGKHFLLVALAITFHWSVILLAPCYFFIKKRLPLTLVLALFIAGNVIYLFGLPSVSLIIRQVARLLPEEKQTLVLGYVSSAVYGKTYGFSLGYIERVIAFLLVLFYQRRMLQENENTIIFINALIIFVFICLYGYEFDIFITRFGALFSFGFWVMYPQLLKVMDKVTAPLYALLLSGIMIVKMHNLSNNILYDYQNFLIEKVDNYQYRKQIFKKYQKKLQQKK